MEINRGTEGKQQRNFWQQFRGRLSRYDLVLAVIPLVFALSLVGHALLPISLHFAVGAGALASGTLVADVLYLHPPTNPPTDA